jgi:vacuolar protein-sorting-associated protein 4
MAPIRELQEATHFKVVQFAEGGDFQKIPRVLVPCNSNDKEAQKMSLFDITEGDVLPRPVTMDDILRSLEVHKPSLTEEELNQYVEWTKKMGQSGA